MQRASGLICHCLLRYSGMALWAFSCLMSKVTVIGIIQEDLQADPTRFRSLRRLGLNTRARKRKGMSISAAEAFMKGLPNLGRLVVNDSCFEVRLPSVPWRRPITDLGPNQRHWTTDTSGAATYVVREVDTAIRLFPWERGSIDGKPSYLNLPDSLTFLSDI